MKTIDNVHPLYKDNAPIWEMIEDFYEGELAVKEKGEAYLPRSNENPQPFQSKKYSDYKSRAPFYEAVSKTVDGMVGLMMHNPYTLEVPESYADINLLTNGSTFDKLVADCLVDHILAGRIGLLVDRSDDGLPYIVKYCADQIINWYSENNQFQLIVLQETYHELIDMFDVQCAIQYRELRMIDGVYHQRIWRKVNGNFVVVADVTPTKKGSVMNYIPFVMTSNLATDEDIEKPMILPLVMANLHHYQQSADLAQAHHYVALPTIVFTGVAEDENKVITVGVDSVVYLSDSNSDAKYLEISGNGLSSLAASIDRLETIMANIGSRLLQERRQGVESAEAISLNQHIETSSMLNTVISVELGIQTAMNYIMDWEGYSAETLTVSLNRDFIDTNISPQQIDALLKIYQAGGMSLQSLLKNLESGEIIESADEELSQLQPTAVPN